MVEYYNRIRNDNEQLFGIEFPLVNNSNSSSITCAKNVLLTTFNQAVKGRSRPIFLG